ncbi:MAG: VOC family protein [Pseudomonadota bacterium]
MAASCFIDHLAVTAPTLEAGVAFVEAALGVRLQPGGQHPRMGTHNRLLRLGESLYLEVIAPDPGLPRPKRPRWFGLDESPASASPRLATWVARCSDVHAALASATEDLGEPMPMERAALQWLISIPADGRLCLGGLAPSLIQWQVAQHPAAGLADAGCALVRLEARTPEPWRLEVLLASLGLQTAVVVSTCPAEQAPRLVAHIDTPGGRRVLGAS